MFNLGDYYKSINNTINNTINILIYYKIIMQ